MPTCEQCGKQFFAGDGAWDNADYLCGECIASHIEKPERTDEKNRSDKQPPETPPQITPKK